MIRESTGVVGLCRVSGLTSSTTASCKPTGIFGITFFTCSFICKIKSIFYSIKHRTGVRNWSSLFDCVFIPQNGIYITSAQRIRTKILFSVLLFIDNLINLSKYRNDKNFPHYRCINISDKINLFTTDRHNLTSIFKPTLFEPFEGKTNIRNIVTVV